MEIPRPPKRADLRKKPTSRLVESLRMFIGLGVIATAIIWSFNRRAEEVGEGSGKGQRPAILTGEPEPIRKIIAADRAFGALELEVLHIKNQKPLPVATEAQQQIALCAAKASKPFLKTDVAAITTLDELHNALIENAKPHRHRLTETVTFQINEQIAEGKKFRARLAPGENDAGSLEWNLYEVSADGLPDLLDLPPSNEERKKMISTLLSRAQVLEHDREELYTYPSGATAAVKRQDNLITEVGLKFDQSLLGCSVEKSKIVCKCL